MHDEATGPLCVKYDVIHKTGSTQRFATPPEEDRATVTGRKISCRSDIPLRRQCSRTDRQTDTLIAILSRPTGGGIITATCTEHLCTRAVCVDDSTVEIPKLSQLDPLLCKLGGL